MSKIGEMSMGVGAILRQVAAEWHSGQGSPLYAVSCGQVPQHIMYDACQELASSLKASARVSPEDTDKAKALLREMRNLVAMGDGFCDCECLTIWLSRETHEEPREGHCRECGEVLGWIYFENIGKANKEGM